MPLTLAIARCWYETNSFTPCLTRVAQFRQREWVAGDAAVAFYRGTRTELGAAVDFIERSDGWRGRFLRCCAASPGGPVAEEDLQAILAEIVRGVSEARADAVYLSLHGALFGENTLCADLDLVRSVHAVIGDKPLAVTFDLHANVAEEIARYVDILIGYKTYPHIDMFEAAQRALALLDARVAGRLRLVVALRKIGAILPSFNMRTQAGPMAEIQAIARAAEARNPALLDISPFGGFAYADTPCAGASVAVTVDGDVQLAQQTATAIAGEMRSRAPQFRVQLATAESAVDDALARLAARSDARPIAVIEPSDNPFSGGAGDTPGLLRAIVERASAVETVFAFFWDPALAERCHAVGAGCPIAIELGARLAQWYGEPVPLNAEVIALTSGRYRNSGPMETGLTVELGKTAVLRVGRKLRIIVTGSCQPPNDPEYFALHGIRLDQVDLLAVKAKNHFRAAFAPLCAAIIEADTPGPAMADMSLLPFRNLPRELRTTTRL